MNDPAISPAVEPRAPARIPDPQGLFDSYDGAKAAGAVPDVQPRMAQLTWRERPRSPFLQSFLTDREQRGRRLYMQDLSPEVFDGWMARIGVLLDRYKKLVGMTCARAWRVSRGHRYWSQ